MDDFTALKETEHMFQWLADKPYAAVRANIEDMLMQQVAGSRLAELRITSAPRWLSGARKSEDEADKVILVRAGVAFEFALRVEAEGRHHDLRGVYTWVGVHLDKPGQQKQRTWLDLDGNLAAFGSKGELMSRVYFELASE